MNWSDFLGQLAGGALGVVIGYLASEYLTDRRRNREEDLARIAVNAELAQNVAEARWFAREIQQLELQELDPSRREDVRGRAFADLRRPVVVSLAWDSHFVRSPEAFSPSEVERMLDYYRAAREVGYFWDEYRIDRQRDSEHFRDAAHANPAASFMYSPMSPRYLSQKIGKLQYRLDQALARAAETDGGQLYEPLLPRVRRWRWRKARTIRGA